MQYKVKVTAILSFAFSSNTNNQYGRNIIRNMKVWLYLKCLLTCEYTLENLLKLNSWILFLAHDAPDEFEEQSLELLPAVTVTKFEV